MVGPSSLFYSVLGVHTPSSTSSSHKELRKIRRSSLAHEPSSLSGHEQQILVYPAVEAWLVSLHSVPGRDTRRRPDIRHPGNRIRRRVME